MIAEREREREGERVGERGEREGERAGMQVYPKNSFSTVLKANSDIRIENSLKPRCSCFIMPESHRFQGSGLGITLRLASPNSCGKTIQLGPRPTKLRY